MNPALRSPLAAVFLGLALSFGALSTQVANAQTSGDARVVSGQVVNGTGGESVAPGVTVVLHRDTAARHDDEETVTDEGGKFRFEGIKFDLSVRYAISVVYQGALYGTDLDLSSGSPDPVTLAVYEATQDMDALDVSTSSLLLTVADDVSRTLWGLEIVKLQNSTDTTYVPGAEPMSLVRFGLPPGATGLQVDSALPGAEVIQVDRGFALMASIPPGEHEVMYSYVFPYEGGQTEISKSFPYGAESVRVLAPYGIAELRSADLGPSEIADVGGKPYRLIEGSNLARGARVTVNVSDLPEPSIGERLRRSLEDVRFEFVAPAALVLLMGFVVAFALVRRDRSGRGRARSDDGEESPSSTGTNGVE